MVHAASGERRKTANGKIAGVLIASATRRYLPAIRSPPDLCLDEFQGLRKPLPQLSIFRQHAVLALVRLVSIEFKRFRNKLIQRHFL